MKHMTANQVDFRPCCENQLLDQFSNNLLRIFVRRKQSTFLDNPKLAPRTMMSTLTRTIRPLSRALHLTSRRPVQASALRMRTLATQAPKVEQSTPEKPPQPQPTTEQQQSAEDDAGQNSSHGREQPPKEGGPVTWGGLALACALGTLGLIYYSRERERRMKGTSRHQLSSLCSLNHAKAYTVDGRKQLTFY